MKTQFMIYLRIKHVINLYRYHDYNSLFIMIGCMIVSIYFLFLYACYRLYFSL